MAIIISRRQRIMTPDEPELAQRLAVPRSRDLLRAGSV